MSQARLDDTDVRMLEILQREGRITNAELAERVNISPSPCLRRLQRLESDGVIAGYTAQLNPKAVGLGLQGLVRVQLEKHGVAVIERFTERVNSWDEVIACFAVSGDMDYLLHVCVADLDHFSRFLLDKLLNGAGVADANSSVVLRTVKQAHALPLGHLVP